MTEFVQVNLNVKLEKVNASDVEQLIFIQREAFDQHGKKWGGWTKDSYNNDWRGNVVLPAERNIEFKAFIKSKDGTVKSWQTIQQSWNPVPLKSTTHISYW